MRKIKMNNKRMPKKKITNNNKPNTFLGRVNLTRENVTIRSDHLIERNDKSYESMAAHT